MFECFTCLKVYFNATSTNFIKSIIKKYLPKCLKDTLMWHAKKTLTAQLA